MSGPVNRKFNFYKLKLDHGDFIDRSSIDHKIKFSLIADRSIDRSMSDDQIGDSIMIAQPCLGVEFLRERQIERETRLSLSY